MGGAGSSAKYGPDSTKLVVDTLKKLPFMQMMDDRLLQDLAVCFQVAKYAKGAAIKNDAASGICGHRNALDTPNSKQLVSELLCQRKAGDYVSYVARDQLVAQMMCDDSDDAPRTAKEARKKLAALLELNRTTADPFVGCTLLKLNFEKFSKLRARMRCMQLEQVDGAFNDKKIQALKRMGAGSYFGEISLVFKIPRVCSITALDDALLVYVDRTAFCSFLKVAPDAAVVLLEHVRLNFLDTLIKQGCAFLNAIPPLKLQELSYMSEIVDYEFDTMIMRRGDQQTCFYILVRGVVEIDYGSTSTIVEAETDGAEDEANDCSNELVLVHPGGYFGQEALLLNSGSQVNADISEDRIHERALVIYLKFLADTAPTPVNMSPGVLAVLEDELSSDGVGRDVFAAVREEILRTMDDESFQNFKMSRVFQEYLMMLHCPQAVYDSLTPEQENLLSMRSPLPLAVRRRTTQHDTVKNNIPAPNVLLDRGFH
ncbi:Cyclic nucleotide-binding-like [Phytophthora cactorum]|nr:Cyclic nucleotide-binding-like [Phytophthora cactorum]